MCSCKQTAFARGSYQNRGHHENRCKIMLNTLHTHTDVEL